MYLMAAAVFVQPQHYAASSSLGEAKAAKGTIEDRTAGAAAAAEGRREAAAIAAHRPRGSLESDQSDQSGQVRSQNGVALSEHNMGWTGRYEVLSFV